MSAGSNRSGAGTDRRGYHCHPAWLESRYEVFHGVKITDNAIIAAATLSNPYITDRFLPDKAIDLIDEACAMIRTEMDSMPTELDVINRKIIQMQIEEAALKKTRTMSFQRRG